MKPILSKEEIDEIIRNVKDEGLPWICDRKARLAEFQRILSRRDERELLLLASCLHQQLLEKGLSASEHEMLRKVGGIIKQKFAFALDISRNEIGKYIQEKLL